MVEPRRVEGRHGTGQVGDAAGQPLPDSVGRPARCRVRFGRQPGDGDEAVAQHPADRLALVRPHRHERVECVLEAGPKRGFEVWTARIVAVRDLDDTRQAQEAVERRGRDAGRQGDVDDGLDEGGELGAVDPHDLLGFGPLQRQGRLDRAALQPPRHRGAGRRLQRIEAGGEAQTKLEPFGVDRFDVPAPERRSDPSGGPGIARHAGQTSGRGPGASCHVSGRGQRAPTNPCRAPRQRPERSWPSSDRRSCRAADRASCPRRRR